MNISMHTFYQRLMFCVLFVLSFTLLSVQLHAQAQAPVFQWEKKVGGTDQFEKFYAVQQTTDGGYITVGNTASSNTGDIGTSKGKNDVLIVKFTALGAKQWQKNIGGAGEDYGFSIQQTTDGGYIVAGLSESSNSGDVTATNHGLSDAWIVKLNASGVIQWQKLLGGDKADFAMSIRQTADGGYLVAGDTDSSNSGDVGLNNGSSDFWVVKLNNLGVIQWQKTIGGTSADQMREMQLTTDGGCIVVGRIFSLTALESDAWMVKLDNLGAIQWQKTFDNARDDVATTVQQTSDGGYIVAGTTYNGSFDSWIMKLTAAGTTEWQKLLSDISPSGLISAVQQAADGGYVIAYNFQSGGIDYELARLLKINSLGVYQWGTQIRSFASQISGSASALQKTTDGGFIVVGFSTNQISFGNLQDAWIAKLVPIESFTPVLDPNKCYRIVNRYTNLPLGVKDSSKADGAQIYQTGYSNSINERWQFIQVADKKYNIKSINSGKMMDILDNSPAGYCAEGTIIQQFTADGTGSQKWRLERQASESFKIYNETCNKPLRLENGSSAYGTSVGIKTDFGTISFEWNIQEVPCVAPIDPSVCYRIVNKATNKVLEIKGGSIANSTQIYQWASAPDRLQQVWSTRKLSDGKYIISSMASGKVIDILDNTAAGFCVEGTIIQQFSIDLTNSQRWGLLPQSDGSYKILNTTCNKYLRVESASTADGANVGIKNDFGSDAFKWYFQAADCFSGAVLSATSATFGFEARASEGRAKLQWITNTGYKTDYFEVERLNANGNFDILGRQNTDGGEGLKSYTFTDNSPYDGDNFYRINSVFQNAPPLYSEVKKVTFSKNDGISIFPNPADEFINVDLRKYEGKTVALSVYNSVGLLVKKQTIEKVSVAPQQIDVQGFGTGSYLLRVQSEGKREVTRLFNITK